MFVGTELCSVKLWLYTKLYTLLPIVNLRVKADYLYLYLCLQQVVETRTVPTQSPRERKTKMPVFYASCKYDGRKLTSLFEDEKENRDPNTSCGVVRRSSVRQKTLDSSKPVLEEQKTGTVCLGR